MVEYQKTEKIMSGNELKILLPKLKDEKLLSQKQNFANWQIYLSSIYISILI